MLRRLLKTMFSFVVSVLVSLAVTGFIVYRLRLRPLQETWGIEPGETERDLPGDDAVAEPKIADTRGITIQGTPAQIWPWLLQLGYGRAGWYSYDRMDNTGSSARHILPEFQALQAGDVIPTFPGGGFTVHAIEPERALVLYLDTELIKQQTAAAPSGNGAGDHAGTEPGLRAAGAMGNMSMPEFRASWAIVLDPIDGRQTRLLERVRVDMPEPTGMQRLGLPFMGLGVFMMTRRQMLGIKERVETLPEPTAETAPETAPVARPQAVPAGS